ncbi:MAG TPA: HEAT repeat domain-containing protein [Syntrophales bacterium]|nr:HEAT repeat domain-containing protein [Syntrophales bacterium]
MTYSVNQEKVLEALIAMNTAAINLRLYPPTNAMIIKTIDRLHETFLNLFEESDSVIFAEAERNLLITGEPLSQKYLGRPQVAIFLTLMINWGIKSLTFVKGLGKNELILFLETMSKKPEEQSKVRLSQIISEGGMPHILFNQKIYVAKDQDHQIVASLEIKDEDIVKYITSEDPDVTVDTQRVKELAKDPEWVARIFQSGMQSIVEKDGTASNIKLSDGMLHMLHILDKVSENADKEKISQLIAGAIGNMDAELIAVTLTKNIESLLENRLFGDIINNMDFEKFEAVAGKLRQVMDNINLENKGADDPRITYIQQAYRHIMNTDKGTNLQHQIQERHAREEEEKKRKIIYLKETSSNILNNLEKSAPHETISQTSPVIVQELFSEGEKDTAETFINRLSDKLISDNTDMRAEVSEALVKILESLSPEKRIDILTKLSGKLIEWIKFESTYNISYSSICTHLRDLVQGWIRDQRFADAYPIVETFRLISSNKLQKNEDIRSVASETLREIASDATLDILMEEFRTNKSDKRNETRRILIMLAEFSVNRLLNLLKESEDSSERVLILNLIPEIGPAAAPAVIYMIKQDIPWYYLRNMVRLLGRIGSEEHAKFLAQFLVYDDYRVQRETLKSISSIGGSRRGEILLEALKKCDDRIKANIVTTLGFLKYRDALKPLIGLFTSKLKVSEEEKVDLQGKICLALGHIGDREALPFLMEISKQSGILSLKSYHPTVKAAAGKAVGWIMSKS